MAHEAVDVEFEIPQRSGQVVCIPPAADFLATARANAALLAGSPLRIGGVPLAQVRAQVRAWTASAARAYTETLGLRPPPARPDGLWLVTGHQPFLFHPGIWIKHLLVHHLAAEDATPLCVPVDCDALEEIGADVPARKGDGAGLRIVRETLLAAPPDVPYEVQPPPDPAVWQAFLGRIDGHLQRLGRPEVQEVFAGFRQVAGQIDGAGDVGTFLTVARRRHEGERAYLELPASRLSAAPQFLAFVLDIVRDAGRFADIYNRHLHRYRERFNVRTAAQPFPDLEREGGRIELPFWTIRAGRRTPLFAERAGRSWRLWAGADLLRTVADGETAAALADLALRPRALALTAFIRLCLADLFVHGVGGGRYDRVTDAVIAEFFGTPPPRYAVVTATLHLPLGEFNTEAERQRLTRRLLQIRHNPERVLEAPSPSQQAMIEEKWRLIGALDRGLPRRERRQATQRIREINEVLAQALGGEQAAVERMLAELSGNEDAATAATHRGYPFCFFSPRAIDALIQAVVPHA